MVNWELKRNRFWEIGKITGLAYFLLPRLFQYKRNQKTDLHEYLSSEICDF